MTAADATATVSAQPGGASDPVTAPKGRAWDLLVVGGGTAGIVAAKTAAGLGASVLLVEQDRTGGDCLWTGCVPSKALLAAAHAAADAALAGQLGVSAGRVRVDFGRVRAHWQQAIASIEPDDDPQALRAAGVRVAFGTATFTGPTDVALTAGESTAHTRFRHALIATGSSPVIPALTGLDPSRVHTSDTVWDLAELPRQLLVLGGGSIGCELGQAFAGLGSEVTIVESAPRILARESSTAAGIVLAALRADGVRVHTGATVAAVTHEGGRSTLTLTGGTQVTGDVLLVAAGRSPNTAGLGLPVAGVTLTEHGQVRVDDRLRTSNPRVFAAGDVTGHPQFTHLAGVHGSLAASNAVLGLRRRVDTAAVPRVMFTRPEVAAFGATPDQPAGSRLHVRTIRHDHVDRAIADNRTEGVTQLVLDHRGRVAGATLVGPRAGECLPELVLAARHGLRARDLAGAAHAYPTYGDGPWKAAIEEVRDRLGRPTARQVISVLRAVERRRRR